MTYLMVLFAGTSIQWNRSIFRQQIHRPHQSPAAVAHILVYEQSDHVSIRIVHHIHIRWYLQTCIADPFTTNIYEDNIPVMILYVALLITII